MRLPFNRSARFVVGVHGVLADRFYKQGEELPLSIFNGNWRAMFGLWLQRKIEVMPTPQPLDADVDVNEPGLPGEEEEDAVVPIGTEQTQQLRASKRRRAA